MIGDKVEIEATILYTGKRKDNLAVDIVDTTGAEEGIFSAGWKLLE